MYQKEAYQIPILQELFFTCFIADVAMKQILQGIQ